MSTQPASASSGGSEQASPVPGAAPATGALPPLDRRLYAWLAMLSSTVLLCIRLWPDQVAFPLNLLEAYAAYALLPMLLAVAYLAVRRLRRSLTLAFVVLALQLWWVMDWVPNWLGAPTSSAGPRVRIATLNLLAPSPSPAFAREIAALDSDILVVSELSDRWAALLDQDGVTARYPHARTEIIPASVSYFGIGILSRHPIVDAEIEHIGHIPMIRVDIDLEGHPLRVHAMHLHPPTSERALAIWERHLARVEELARDDVAAARTSVITGDFNATTSTRAFRRLTATGLVPAHDAALRPFAVTWPNGTSLLPPIRIDHVFVHRARVLSVSEGIGEGSDHRPIVTELALP